MDTRRDRQTFRINSRTYISNYSKFRYRSFFNIQEQFYKKHKSVEELAKFHNLDTITTWAIVLQNKDDLERFNLFGKPEYQDDAPRIYNVWNFNQCDPTPPHSIILYNRGVTLI